MKHMELNELIEIVKKHKRIAIDGRCASGKSTLGKLLQKETGGNLIHMDDFFLRPEQRTNERYATPGENVDHERFYEEVLTPLIKGKEFFFHPFDCNTMQISANRIYVKQNAVTIVEGSYSLHPQLRDAYDLKIFMDIDPAIQLERLQKRNPEKMEDFKNKWIPYEELYFSQQRVEDICDIILKNFDKN